MSNSKTQRSSEVFSAESTAKILTWVRSWEEVFADDDAEISGAVFIDAFSEMLSDVRSCPEPEPVPAPAPAPAPGTNYDATTVPVDAWKVLASLRVQKSCRSVLRAVRVTCSGQTAYDGETMIRRNVHNGSGPYDPFAVDSSDVKSALRLTKKTLTITAEDSSARMIGDGTDLGTFGAVAWDELPELPNGTGFTADDVASAFYSSATDLANVFARMVPIAAKDKTRFAFNGIRVDIGDQETTFVATDGKILGVLKLDSSTPTPEAQRVSVIVPTTMVDAIRKVSTLKENRGASATLTVGPKYVQVSVGTWEIVGKLISGTFPDYRQLFPKNGRPLGSFHSETTLRACDVADVRLASANAPIREHNRKLIGKRLREALPEQNAVAFVGCCGDLSIREKVNGKPELDTVDAAVIRGRADVEFQILLDPNIVRRAVTFLGSPTSLWSGEHGIDFASNCTPVIAIPGDETIGSATVLFMPCTCR